jgi:hypothetical protein
VSLNVKLVVIHRVQNPIRSLNFRRSSFILNLILAYYFRHVKCTVRRIALNGCLSEHIPERLGKGG